MTVQSRIEEIKRTGYDIDFGDIFNKSFENYKQIALSAGVVILLFCMIAVAVVLGLTGAFWGFSSFTENMTALESGTLSVAAMVAYIAGGIILSGLVAPFTAGLLKMAHLAAQNQDFSIGNAFDYYKSPHFKDLFFSALVIGFFSMTSSTVLQNFGFSAIGMLITYAIAFFTFLTIPLIIFGNLTAIEAIKGSLLIVSKQIFLLLGLLIVALLVAFLGIIGFCIGFLFTVPFIYSTQYCIYDEIIGVDEHNELDQIGTFTE